jgi:phosphopantetheinyl transferase (holo-ACP synthase)
MSGGIGNDVVDLCDPDSRSERLHPRFDERAFFPDERAWIGGGPEAARRRWCLWAAKEAAHKALAQEALARTGEALRFAPGRYHAALDARGCGYVELATLAQGCGYVELATLAPGAGPERAIPVHVGQGLDWIHALAVRGDPARAHAGLLRIDGAAEPRRAARRLLLASFPEPAAVTLERVGRIPRARLAGREGPVAVSLSHHGRLVAFARLEPDARVGGS